MIKKLPGTIAKTEDAKRLIRSSGAIRVNYIEANEKLGDKDLKYRLKLARKEVKESKYWLRLLKDCNEK